jgi:hypothetical protein
MVAATLRIIFALPDATHVCEQLDTVAGMLGRQLPKGATLRKAVEELTVFADTARANNPWKMILDDQLETCYQCQRR